MAGQLKLPWHLLKGLHQCLCHLCKTRHRAACFYFGYWYLFHKIQDMMVLKSVDQGYWYCFDIVAWTLRNCIMIYSQKCIWSVIKSWNISSDTMYHSVVRGMLRSEVTEYHGTQIDFGSKVGILIIMYHVSEVGIGEGIITDDTIECVNCFPDQKVLMPYYKTDISSELVLEMRQFFTGPSVQLISVKWYNYIACEFRENLRHFIIDWHVNHEKSTLD